VLLMARGRPRGEDGCTAGSGVWGVGCVVVRAHVLHIGDFALHTLLRTTCRQESTSSLNLVSSPSIDRSSHLDPKSHHAQPSKPESRTKQYFDTYSPRLIYDRACYISEAEHILLAQHASAAPSICAYYSPQNVSSIDQSLRFHCVW
jgi:hypothetical protein